MYSTNKAHSSNQGAIMKVLMFLPDFKPTGPFIVAYNIAKYNTDPEQEFVFLSMRTNNYPSELDCQFDNRSLDSSKIPTFITLCKLKNYIEKNDIDIVHTHGFWPTILASYLPKNIKKVVTIHNNPYEDYCYEYGSVIGKGMANLLRYRLPKFYKIVSISAFVKESLSYDLSNHLVIHNGVSLHKIDAISNSGTDVNISNRSSPFNIGIVSALIPRKNIFEAVDIVVELNTNGFSCSLDIVGEGEQREELYNYITSHGANDYITLKGSLSYNETLKFISELDLFIFTSFSEGFGLVLVEAMMLKVPILAKTSKISLEVLGDERLCFSSFNDFREKLETITSNVTDILELQHARYRDKFTAIIMANRYSECYYDMY